MTNATATDTAKTLLDLKVGDKVKISVQGVGFVKGTVSNIDADGLDITGPRGSANAVWTLFDGIIWAMKGIGSMSPKAGPVEGIEHA